MINATRQGVILNLSCVFSASFSRLESHVERASLHASLLVWVLAVVKMDVEFYSKFAVDIERSLIGFGDKLCV